MTRKWVYARLLVSLTLVPFIVPREARSNDIFVGHLVICSHNDTPLEQQLQQELRALSQLAVSVKLCTPTTKAARLLAPGPRRPIVGMIDVNNETRTITVDLASSQPPGRLHQETDFSTASGHTADRNIAIICAELVRALLLTLKETTAPAGPTPTKPQPPSAKPAASPSHPGGVTLFAEGLQPGRGTLPEVGVGLGGFIRITPSVELGLQGGLPLMVAQKNTTAGNIELRTVYGILEIARILKTGAVGFLLGAAGGILAVGTTGVGQPGYHATSHQLMAPYLQGRIGIILGRFHLFQFFFNGKMGFAPGLATIKPTASAKKITLFLPGLSLDLGIRWRIW